MFSLLSSHSSLFSICSLRRQPRYTFSPSHLLSSLFCSDAVTFLFVLRDSHNKSPLCLKQPLHPPLWSSSLSWVGVRDKKKATEERYINKGAYIILEPPSFDTPIFHSFEDVSPRPKVNSYYDFEDIIDFDDELDLVSMEPHSGVKQPAA